VEVILKSEVTNPHKVDLDLCLAALRKLSEGPTQYEAIRRHVIRVTARGSPGKMDRAMRDIVRNGWAEKTGQPGSRAPYKITDTGKLFLLSFES